MSHELIGAGDAFRFESRGFARSRGVGEFHRPAVESDLNRDYIASRAGKFGHDRPLITGQRVDE